MTGARIIAAMVLWNLAIVLGAQNRLAEAHAQSSEVPRTEQALHRVPVHTSDRTEDAEARRKRLRALAVAIDAATEDKDLRAWLVMTAQRESGLAAYVTEDGDRCRLGQGGRCDAGKAFGAWQLHRMTRAESYAEQATEAVRRFKMAANSCKAEGGSYWLGGIARYATGAACDWAGAADRLASMRAVRAHL